MSRSRLACILALSSSLSACGGSAVDEPTVTASEVRVSTSQMEVSFERGAPLSETYMVFGGIAMNRPDALSKITIVGLAMADAQPIFSRYPDFHRCASPGASLAQSATRQMDIVPATGAVLANLEDVLAQHEASVRESGDRVCVRLSGSVIEISSAIAQETDITNQLPAALKHEYYLVEEAELVDARSALAP